ncbi:MAG: ATP-binding protein [Chloroflexota bacterium]|nr:ATP-binding protein [Chloroflexota bacterium]
MESLLVIFAAAFIPLVYAAFRLRRKVQSLEETVSSQDSEIDDLRRQRFSAECLHNETRALYSAQSEVAFDLALVLDEAGVIHAHNQAAERLFGDRSAVGEQLCAALGSGDLANLVDYTLNEHDSLEEQFVIEDVYYRARTQVASMADGRRFVAVAMQDVTNLVNLNRARRDLVANISHELRTPITRIRLIIEGLFLDADRPKRKASIQSLKEIAMETDALLWLSQELLDLSMIESGEAIMRLVPTSLTQVVDEAIERLMPQAEMKDLTIVSHVPRRFAVLCDADQLKRVLGNLIHNAIKWSPSKQAITITAAELGDEVSVSILDKGPGVPEDLRERIFERFYQADVSRSGDDGTGLGLAICKHIIEAHGGRIWAEGNSRGEGGHFLFTVLKADANFEIETRSALVEAASVPAADIANAGQLHQIFSTQSAQSAQSS